VVALALLCGLAASNAIAAADLPMPLRVGLTGDSIVEDGGVTSSEGLGAALRSRLRELGYHAFGWGYVPAHSSSLRLSDDGTVSSAPWRYSGAWTVLGVTPFFDPASPIAHVMESPFGADGHAMESASPLAAATAEVAGDRFSVLFVRAPDAGAFRFTVDGRARTVDARSPVVDGGGIARVLAPSDRRARHTLAVAPLSGTLRFTGVLSERTRRSSSPRIDLLSLGRSCACASDPFPRAQRQALRALDLDLTLIMFGTNGQGELQVSNDPATRDAILAGLRTRGALARRDGGACLIVPPAPNPRPLAIQHEIRVLERRAAADTGCVYAPVLKHLWDGSASVSTGYTVDGIHPTPSGYRRMADALAGVILRHLPAAGGR
jgi:lysophospholipase L1-like esterase